MMLSDSRNRYGDGRKSSQSHESEIVFRAAGLSVVEAVDVHVHFLNFLGAVIERACRVDSGCDGDDHFRCQHRAVAALGLTPNSLIKDMKTFGFIFECLCARDLKVYSAPLGTELNYYHDRYNLEADFVLHVADGRYALIECKLGSNDIEEGAEHLIA